MTAGGWLMMVLAAGGMTGFLAWCVCRVVATPGTSGHIHSQADIQPPDRDD